MLKYSSTKPKLRYMGKFRVLLSVPVLYMSIGPCNLSTKAKIWGTVLKPNKVTCRHHICSS